MKKRMVCMTAALLVGTAMAQPLLDSRAPEFSLHDQYEKTVSLRQYEGRIVVLIASDKEGSAQNPEWIKAVRGRYGERISIQGIADVSGVPFFLKGKVRNDFKKDGESILLDWKGEVFRSYGFANAISNIVLIDSRGVIRHRSSGSASPEAVQELFKKIDALNY
jgi:predicted transcriptional regulator